MTPNDCQSYLALPMLKGDATLSVLMAVHQLAAEDCCAVVGGHSLAARTGLGHKTALRKLEELQAAGVLEQVEAPAGSRGATYRILPVQAWPSAMFRVKHPGQRLWHLRVMPGEKRRAREEKARHLAQEMTRKLLPLLDWSPPSVTRKPEGQRVTVGGIRSGRRVPIAPPFPSSSNSENSPLPPTGMGNGSTNGHGHPSEASQLPDLVHRVEGMCVARDRARVRAEAAELVAWAATYVDRKMLEEVLGWAAGALTTPPTFPRALAPLIVKRAAGYGIVMAPFEIERAYA